VTPEQLQQYRDRLKVGRQPQSKWSENPHPRGWNDALEFAERTLKEVLGEEADAPGT